MSALAQQWSDASRNSERLAGPQWLEQLRTAAADQLQEHGLPQRRDEAWKYTPMRLLEKLNPTVDGFDQQGALSGSEGEDLMPPALLEKPDCTIDICDGQLTTAVENLQPGVTILSLAEGLKLHEAKLRKQIEAVDINGSSGAFAALNTAFLQHGLLIHVKPQINAGSMLLRWAFSAGTLASLHNFRIFLLLEKGSKLQLTEQFESLATGGKALNVISHFDLEEDSNLNHVRLQNEQENSVLMTSTRAIQGENSRYTYAGFDLGGGLVRHELSSKLAGRGAQVIFNGAFVLDHQRHVDNHVSVEHAAPDCSSEQFFRGVLGGRSRGVFNGRALISAGADGSSVRQSNANLLLSGLAEIDTKPELEIYADEVVASHGATVGQLDEAAVFYLRTRGLSDAAARRILTSAFCRTVTERLEHPALASRISELIDEAMPSDTVI